MDNGGYGGALKAFRGGGTVTFREKTSGRRFVGFIRYFNTQNGDFTIKSGNFTKVGIAVD